MNIYLAMALCFLPLVLSAVAVKLSSGAPVLVLLFSVLLALVMVVPVSIVEGAALRVRWFRYTRHFVTSTQPPVASLLFCIVAVGLVEEVSKALMLLALPVRRALLTDLQAVLCALVFGLAVGCFESAAYFLDAIDKAASMGSHPIYSSIFSRIFTADMLHSFCAALGGIFILSIKREEVKTDTVAIVWAILIHGIYDFLVINSRYPWLSIAAILLAIVEVNSHYRKFKRALSAIKP